MRLTPLKTRERGNCFLSPQDAAASPNCQRGIVRLAASAGLLGALACGGEPVPTSPPGEARPPSILLVTLDTARADAFGFEGGPAATPALDRLAAESTVVRGYATAPMTLPSHTSMMTGLYPSEHGIHENARRLDDELSLLAQELKGSGYRTEAYVSALPLDGSFGLARGFDTYQDDVGPRGERSAAETNRLVLERLGSFGERARDNKPTFLWVHYFDPHAPYLEGATDVTSDDLATYGALGADTAARYLHEIETVDRAFGELLTAARNVLGDDLHVLVVGDHGESLGEHGERTHGNLLFEPVLRVPMMAHEPGRPAEASERAVSVRRVYGTILRWAWVEDAEPSIFDDDGGSAEPILAEAMQPFLQYGWQPHVAAVRERSKGLLFGSQEFGASLLGFDLAADPAELRPNDEVAPELRAALRAYSLPDDGSDDADTMNRQTVDAETRRRLAELGYITGSGTGVGLRPNAPRAIEMTHLFDALDRASIAFERGDYDEAVDPLTEIVGDDPNNFAAVLRLAVAYSLRSDRRAEDWFARARAIAPDSTDLQHYEGMHRMARGDLDTARILFDAVLRREPRRLTTLRALARVAAQRGDELTTLDTLHQLASLDPQPGELQELGRRLMNRGRTEEALLFLEQARDLAPSQFDAALELGVLLLESRRFNEARDALESELQDDSELARSRRAMTLFKRAQVAVLLDESDADDRIQDAIRGSDPSTARLIANERLFESRRPR